MAIVRIMFHRVVLYFAAIILNNLLFVLLGLRQYSHPVSFDPFLKFCGNLVKILINSLY
jgi:hypothetical protein